MHSEELRKLAIISALRQALIFRALRDEDVERIAGYVVPRRLAKDYWLAHPWSYATLFPCVCGR